MTTNRRTLALLLVGLTVSLSVIASTLARPDPAQLAAMADAIKYLQELDKYYSQVARPSTRSDSSFASSPRLNVDISSMKQALKMIRLQELDRFYSHRSRPRFGKRSDEQADMEDGYDQGSDEALKQRWRRDVSSR